MNLVNNTSIMRWTIEKSYPGYLWNSIFKKLEGKGLIINDGRRSKTEGILDVTGFEDNAKKLSYLFENLNSMVKNCEEFEYDRGYRYSSLCKYKQISLDKLEGLIQSGKVILFTEDDQPNDILIDSIAYPTVKYDNNEIYLKFSLKLKSKLEDQGDLKHTILTIINLDNKTIEVRQDIIPLEYKLDEKVYISNVKSVRTWLESKLEVEVEEIDLQAITKYMKSNKQDEVKITAVRLRRDGMTAELDAASNADLTLPILDELRNKISRESIFTDNETGLKIKSMLEEFMLDIEENSDLPAAKIFWTKKDIKVNSYHGEVVDEIAYLRWIGELKNKECMDYVTQYIINTEEELREQFED